MGLGKTLMYCAIPAVVTAGAVAIGYVTGDSTFFEWEGFPEQTSRYLNAGFFGTAGILAGLGLDSVVALASNDL